MTVTVERREGFAVVFLDRPESRNAITGPLGTDLAAALTQLNSDDAIDVIVLAGRGGAFCSGLDLKAFNADPPPPWVADFKSIWRGAHRALFHCEKPIIGALERYAINGGAALALACDLLIVGDEAFLHVGEARIGMAAPYNLAWMQLRLPEVVAMKLSLLAKRINGPELLSLGIATECVADADVLARAEALAAELAAFPGGALARIKRTTRALKGPIDPDELFDLAIKESAGGASPPPVSGNTK